MAVTLAMHGLLRRPPLRFSELQPGLSTRGDVSFEALSLEVRQILARRYAPENRLAEYRVPMLAKALVAQDKTPVVRALDATNEAILFPEEWHKCRQ